MTRPRPDAEEVELHPQYDMAAQLDELYSVPLYRRPEHELIEQWREIGERLLALGERSLRDGLDGATGFLEARLAERRRRRERRAAKRRAVREAQQAARAAAQPAGDSPAPAPAPA
jgi:hypothetical protein